MFELEINRVNQCYGCGSLFCLQGIDYYFVAQSVHVTEQVIHICSREILKRAGPPCIGTICFALHSGVQQGLMNVNKWLVGNHTIFQKGIHFWRISFWFLVDCNASSMTGSNVPTYSQGCNYCLVAREYRKMPKISPGAYIFQRLFLGGLYSKGLIYGGKFAFQNQVG